MENGHISQGYHELKVWQRAIELAPEVYRLLRRFPKEEVYALASQIRRAAVSVPANIAEGQARRYTREYLHHLMIAQGSLAELDTLWIIASKLEYISSNEVEPIQAEICEIRKMLNGLAKGLEARL